MAMAVHKVNEQSREMLQLKSAVDQVSRQFEDCNRRPHESQRNVEKGLELVTRDSIEITSPK